MKLKLFFIISLIMLLFISACIVRNSIIERNKPNYCIRVRNIMKGNHYLIEFRYNEYSNWVSIKKNYDFRALCKSNEFIFNSWHTFNNKSDAINFAKQFTAYTSCIVYNTKLAGINNKLKYKETKYDIETIYCE